MVTNKTVICSLFFDSIGNRVPQWSQTLSEGRLNRLAGR